MLVYQRKHTRKPFSEGHRREKARTCQMGKMPLEEKDGNPGWQNCRPHKFHEKDVHRFRPVYEKGDPDIGIRDEIGEPRSLGYCTSK